MPRRLRHKSAHGRQCWGEQIQCCSSSFAASKRPRIRHSRPPPHAHCMRPRTPKYHKHTHRHQINGATKSNHPRMYAYDHRFHSTTKNSVGAGDEVVPPSGGGGGGVKVCSAPSARRRWPRVVSCWNECLSVCLSRVVRSHRPTACVVQAHCAFVLTDTPLAEAEKLCQSNCGTSLERQRMRSPGC